MRRLVIFLLPLLSFSCFRIGGFLPLLETPITIKGGGYGVVITPYLRLSDKPGIATKEVATLRIGDIVRIDQIRATYDTQKEIWGNNYYVLLDEEKIAGWSSSEFIEQFKYERTAEVYKRVLESKRTGLSKKNDNE